MSESILNSLVSAELQHFILARENEDEQNLILKHKTIHGVPSSIVADQIRGRRKAKIKIPEFYNISGVIYPPRLNLEQSSSETTGKFKAELFKTGKRFADLTGGFGIDTLQFSKIFEVVHYVEPVAELLEIVKHNHRQLGIHNIHHHNLSAENFLRNTDQHFDLIYLDPSRRTKENKKVFKWSDCTPDIPFLLPKLFEKSNTVLIKASPLLDIQQGLRELFFVERIFVVSVRNDCKELLFLCKKNFTEEPVIETFNILSDQTERFQFTLSSEQKADVKFSEPLAYLYEPNASVLKAGAYKSLGTQFDLLKIHSSTHIYTSEKLVINFPGRIFKLKAYLRSDPKAVKHYLPERKANIITRNYPMSPEQLRKKLNLLDGGEDYILGFSGAKSKYLVLAKRVA